MRTLVAVMTRLLTQRRPSGGLKWAGLLVAALECDRRRKYAVEGHLTPPGITKSFSVDKMSTLTLDVDWELHREEDCIRQGHPDCSTKYIQTYKGSMHLKGF